jgi:hypothetical protein
MAIDYYYTIPTKEAIPHKMRYKDDCVLSTAKDGRRWVLPIFRCYLGIYLKESRKSNGKHYSEQPVP